MPLMSVRPSYLSMLRHRGKMSTAKLHYLPHLTRVQHRREDQHGPSSARTPQDTQPHPALWRSEWREPAYEEFQPRTIWSFFNAFTAALKETNLQELPKRTEA